MKDIKKFGLTLFLICAISAFLLALVNKITKPKIIAQAKADENLSLKSVMSEAYSFEEFKKGSEVLYYKALDKNNELIGYCFKVSKYGYSSDIITMVGIDKDSRITGIEILSQNETPGLGAKIIDKSFGERFKGKPANSLAEVDAITGATISSRAVISSIGEKAKFLLEEIKNAK